MSDQYGICCGWPVDPDTGKCQHRDYHPRHLTPKLLDRLWQLARQASRERRDPLKDAVEYLFGEDAKANGYTPAPDMPEKPQDPPLWL